MFRPSMLLALVVSTAGISLQIVPEQKMNEPFNFENITNEFDADSKLCFEDCKRRDLADQEESEEDAEIAKGCNKGSDDDATIESETVLDLAAQLKGKSCALVGGGASLKGAGLGEEIDKHDFVIRVNRLPVDGEFKEELGERTDILFAKGYGGDSESESSEIWFEPNGRGKAGGKKNKRSCDYTVKGSCPFQARVCSEDCSQRKSGSGGIMRNNSSIDFAHFGLICCARSLLKTQGNGTPSTGYKAFLAFRPMCASMTLYGFGDNGGKNGQLNFDGHGKCECHNYDFEHMLLDSLLKGNILDVPVDPEKGKEMDNSCKEWFNRHPFTGESK